MPAGPAGDAIEPVDDSRRAAFAVSRCRYRGSKGCGSVLIKGRSGRCLRRPASFPSRRRRPRRGYAPTAYFSSHRLSRTGSGPCPSSPRHPENPGRAARPVPRTSSVLRTRQTGWRVGSGSSAESRHEPLVTFLSPAFASFIAPSICFRYSRCAATLVSLRQFPRRVRLRLDQQKTCLAGDRTGTSRCRQCGVPDLPVSFASHHFPQLPAKRARKQHRSALQPLVQLAPRGRRIVPCGLPAISGRNRDRSGLQTTFVSRSATRSARPSVRRTQRGRLPRSSFPNFFNQSIRTSRVSRSRSRPRRPRRATRLPTFPAEIQDQHSVRMPIE